MDELVKVQTNENGTQVVSARDLHQFVVVEANGGQTGEMFAHWIKRMLEYGFKEGLDYVIEEYDLYGNPIAKSSKPDNQQVRVQKREYILTIDTAKHIAMVQKNDKGDEARRYFIECERKLKSINLPNFEDPAEAAIAWAKQYKEKQYLLLEVKEKEERLNEVLPKAEYFDGLVDNGLNVSFRDAAKEFGIKQHNFIDFLIEKKLVYRDSSYNLKPYSSSIDKGYFVIKEWKRYNTSGLQTLITPEGRLKLLKMLKVEN